MASSGYARPRDARGSSRISGSPVRHVTARGVSWDVDDPKLENDPWRFWDDWERLDFEPYTLDTIQRLVTRGSTVCDIGAWIGPVTLWANHLGARVVAVEPDPYALALLHKNVDANCTNVDIFAGAIRSHTGTCRIQADPAGWGSSMTRVMSEGTEVPGLTMPDLFDIYDIENCALVKVDVEGSECDLLEHAAPFLAELKIPLLVAMHQPWWTQPVRPDWFSGYGSIDGTFADFGQVLALP